MDSKPSDESSGSVAAHLKPLFNKASVGSWSSGETLPHHLILRRPSTESWERLNSTLLPGRLRWIQLHLPSLEQREALNLALPSRYLSSTQHLESLLSTAEELIRLWILQEGFTSLTKKLQVNLVRVGGSSGISDPNLQHIAGLLDKLVSAYKVYSLEESVSLRLSTELQRPFRIVQNGRFIDGLNKQSEISIWLYNVGRMAIGIMLSITLAMSMVDADFVRSALLKILSLF